MHWLCVRQGEHLRLVARQVLGSPSRVPLQCTGGPLLTRGQCWGPWWLLRDAVLLAVMLVTALACGIILVSDQTRLQASFLWGAASATPACCSNGFGGLMNAVCALCSS